MENIANDLAQITALARTTKEYFNMAIEKDSFTILMSNSIEDLKQQQTGMKKLYDYTGSLTGSDIIYDKYYVYVYYKAADPEPYSLTIKTYGDSKQHYVRTFVTMKALLQHLRTRDIPDRDTIEKALLNKRYTVSAGYDVYHIIGYVIASHRDTALIQTITGTWVILTGEDLKPLEYKTTAELIQNVTLEYMPLLAMAGLVPTNVNYIV